MKRDLQRWGDFASHLKILQLLQKGNIIVGSSDTVLGLLSDTTEHGAMLLNEIKGRSKKPYLILIESFQKAAWFVSLEDLARYENLIKSFWPGPLTLIFKAKDGVPSWAKGEDGTVALRVPKHDGLLAILPHFHGLFSTSANKTGQPVAQTLEEIDPDILNRAGAIILDPEQKTSQSLPSTILDLSGAEPKIVRQGTISWFELEKILSKND